LPSISRFQEEHANRNDSPDKEKLLTDRQTISRTSSSSQARNFALGGRGLGYLSNVDDIVVRLSRCDIEFVARNGWFSMTV